MAGKVFLYRSKDVSTCVGVSMFQCNAYRADEFSLQIEQARLWGSDRGCQWSRHVTHWIREILLDISHVYRVHCQLHLKDSQSV